MSLAIVKHPRAVDDVAAVHAYLADVDLALAERFLTAVDADLERIADTPGIGSPRRFTHPDLAGLQSRGVTGFRNHLIF